MTAAVEDYFDEVERLLLFSPVVVSFWVREWEERLQEGLFVSEPSFPIVIYWKQLSLWLLNLKRFRRWRTGFTGRVEMAV